MLPIGPTYRSASAALIVILFIVSALPWLVSQSIGHSTLSGRKKKWIDELTKRVGLGNTPVKIWRTNHRNMNAMAIGFISPFRTLFLSDQLIEELPPKQLSMVLLHEASHLKRQHLPIRLICTVPIWLTAAAFSPWLEQHQGIASLTTVICMVLTLIVLRWVAHQTEYDADTEACRLAVHISKDLDGVPQTLCESSRELSRALLKVSRQRSIARKSTWMHPSVLTRIQNMRSHPHSEAKERGLTSESATRMQAELTSAAC
ncbi:MAG: M48 family metalloprotease, partial [Planctomycetota bacterium]|nr:M48 family metalloprotease [Planctomycetota bacterium]